MYGIFSSHEEYSTKLFTTYRSYNNLFSADKKSKYWTEEMFNRIIALVTHNYEHYHKLHQKNIPDPMIKNTQQYYGMRLLFLQSWATPEGFLLLVQATQQILAMIENNECFSTIESQAMGDETHIVKNVLNLLGILYESASASENFYVKIPLLDIIYSNPNGGEQELVAFNDNMQQVRDFFLNIINIGSEINIAQFKQEKYDWVACVMAAIKMNHELNIITQGLDRIALKNLFLGKKECRQSPNQTLTNSPLLAATDTKNGFKLLGLSRSRSISQGLSKDLSNESLSDCSGSSDTSTSSSSRKYKGLLLKSNASDN